MSHTEAEQDLGSEAAFEHLLGEARQMSQRILDNLRALQERFPTDFPRSELDQLEDFLGSETRDRRRGYRCTGSSLRVEINPLQSPEDVTTTRVSDLCVSGLGIWFPHAVEEGSLLEVRPSDSCAEVALVRVKHCLLRENGWLLGCEVVARSFRLDNANP